MKNWKIRYKLLVLVSSLILALLFTGIVSLIFMASINNGTTEVSENWLPSVIIGEELNTATSDFRIAENSHVIAQDESTMHILENTMNDIVKRIDDMFNYYITNLITNETDRKLIEKSQDMWEQYLELHNVMIKYSSDNNTQAAYEILTGESSILFNEFSETFLDLVDFNKEGADQANLDGNKLYSDAILFMVIITILITVVALLFSFYIVKLIADPINEIEEAAIQILKGDLNTDIRYNSKDELGVLANNMKLLCQMFKNMIIDIDDRLDRLAKGDFKELKKMQSFYVGDFKSVFINMEKIQVSLAETLVNIDVVATQLATGTIQVTHGAQGVAGGVVEQAASVQNLSAAMEEMTAKITQTADDTGEAKVFNEKTQKALVDSNNQVSEMVIAMKNIITNSDEIKKIIQDIDDIAFQTNILSLNAAVEAARAGESGKGFAVVAEEVRNLAKKSAKSAKDTAELIQQTAEVISVGNEIAGHTSDSISAAMKNAKELSTLVDSIADAAEDQAQNAIQINAEIDQISKVVMTNSTSAEESAAASEELSEQSQTLKNLIGEFKF